MKTRNELLITKNDFQDMMPLTFSIGRHFTKSVPNKIRKLHNNAENFQRTMDMYDCHLLECIQYMGYSGLFLLVPFLQNFE